METPQQESRYCSRSRFLLGVGSILIIAGSLSGALGEERASVPDYTCQAALEPSTVGYSEVCSVELARGSHRVDILMPFILEGRWRLSVNAGAMHVMHLECRSVERAGHGSWNCEEYWSNGEGAGSSGLLWADSYLLIRVPAGSVLTLYSGSGFGVLSLRGRILGA